jgi:hypothetical protein
MSGYPNPLLSSYSRVLMEVPRAILTYSLGEYLSRLLDGAPIPGL